MGASLNAPLHKFELTASKRLVVEDSMEGKDVLRSKFGAAAEPSAKITWGSIDESKTNSRAAERFTKS